MSDLARKAIELRRLRPAIVLAIFIAVFCIAIVSATPRKVAASILFETSLTNTDFAQDADCLDNVKHPASIGELDLLPVPSVGTTKAAVLIKLENALEVPHPWLARGPPD